MGIRSAFPESYSLNAVLNQACCLESKNLYEPYHKPSTCGKAQTPKRQLRTPNSKPTHEALTIEITSPTENTSIHFLKYCNDSHDIN